MTNIAIYVEGGGDTAQQKADLRTGLDQLLGRQKQAARNKRLGWKLVPCGGRDNARKAFLAAIHNSAGQTLCVLLVDAEEGLPAETTGQAAENAQARKNHLIQRDRWHLANIDPHQIHLMVQCMEAWIVADPDALARYYGKKFLPQKLPNRRNLEEEPKAQLYEKLADATRLTTRGEYSESNQSKIRHGSKLLSLLDPEQVAQRCPRFATLTAWLDEQIQKA
jgi:hypothetical protein